MARKAAAAEVEVEATQVSVFDTPQINWSTPTPPEGWEIWRSHCGTLIAKDSASLVVFQGDTEEEILEQISSLPEVEPTPKATRRRARPVEPPKFTAAPDMSELATAQQMLLDAYVAQSAEISAMAARFAAAHGETHTALAEISATIESAAVEMREIARVSLDAIASCRAAIDSMSSGIIEGVIEETIPTDDIVPPVQIPVSLLVYLVPVDESDDQGRDSAFDLIDLLEGEGKAVFDEVDPHQRGGRWCIETRHPETIHLIKDGTIPLEIAEETFAA